MLFSEASSRGSQRIKLNVYIVTLHILILLSMSVEPSALLSNVHYNLSMKDMDIKAIILIVIQESSMVKNKNIAKIVS